MGSMHDEVRLGSYLYTMMLIICQDLKSGPV